MAGINFAAVGADRALCRVCPMADLGDVHLCEHVDVCTVLSKDKTGALLIEVNVWCALGNSATHDEERCARCSARRGVVQVTSQTTSWLIPILT